MIEQDYLDIGSRRELFVDDYIVGVLRGAERALPKPQLREKVLTLDSPWEGGRCGYACVCSHGGTHYMYYRGSGFLKPHDLADSTSGPEVTCVALSTDGVHWMKPDLGIHEVAGTRKNNLILSDIFYSHNFTAFVDSKPGVPEDERFKALAGAHISMLPERYPGHEMGVSAFVSGDGLHWRRKGERPVMDERHWPEVSDKSSIPVFWSDLESHYVAYFRIRVGPDHLSPAKRLRWVGRTTSEDFVNWSAVEPIEYEMGYSEQSILANADSRPRTTDEELYTLQAAPYCRAPHIYISLPNRIVSGRRILSTQEMAGLHMADFVDRPQLDTSIHDSLLMVSRDGVRFELPTKDAFLRPGFDRRNWDNRSQYFHTGMVQTAENELSLYFNRHGFTRSSPSTAHFMRCSIRTDGFASIHGPYEGGELITKPMVFEGARLEVNYDTSAAGSIRVEIQDREGRPVNGHEIQESDPLIGDEVDRVVCWNGKADLSSLAGRPIRLRFVMKDADLYSLRFAIP